MEIRPITTADIDACHAIVLANWNPTVAKRFLSEISQVWAEMNDPHIYYVAVESGFVVGFIGIMQSYIMHGIWDLVWVNTHKDFQGEGIGTELVEYCLREILECDGRAVHLMTKTPTYFEQFGFNSVKEYGEWKLMSLWLGVVEL